VTPTITENPTVTENPTITVTAAQTPGSFLVTFVLTDKVTGKAVHDAKVSMDGIQKETNRYGTAVFNTVSLGNHNYKIMTDHYKKIERTIKVNKNMDVSVQLVPVDDKK
jgi:hypothetical protein